MCAVILKGHKKVKQCCIICRPKRNALFLVDLQLDTQGVHYSTNLNNFETMSVGLFDRGIQSTQSVPQLEKVFLLSLVFHAETLPSLLPFPQSLQIYVKEIVFLFLPLVYSICKSVVNYCTWCYISTDLNFIYLTILLITVDFLSNNGIILT